MDIFDQIQPDETYKGDIFDRVEASMKSQSSGSLIKKANNFINDFMGRFSISPTIVGTNILPKETQIETMRTIYDRPSSAIRSRLMGGGFREGWESPEDIPKFKSLIDAELRRRTGFDEMSTDARTLIESATPPSLKAGYETVTSLPDFLTNPAELATALALGKAIPKIGRLSSGEGTSLLERARRARDAFTKPKTIDIPKMTAQAEKLTTEILQPSKGQLQSQYERGLKYRPSEVAARYIKKSKNYDELYKILDNAGKAKIEERNFLIKRYNRPIGRTYINSLKKYITEQRRLGQTTDNEMKTMREVLDNEVAWAKRQRKLNTVKAQRRKEYLEDMTEKLLEKRELGESVSRDPPRSRALDVLRDALKEKIEMSHPLIKMINEIYGALQKAKSLVAGQKALADKAIPQSFWQKILPFLKSPKNIPGEVARSAMDRERSLLKVTEQIERLMRQAKQ